MTAAVTAVLATAATAAMVASAPAHETRGAPPGGSAAVAVRALGLLLVALALPPRAAVAMEAAAFEAMTAGRTLHFSLDGAPFGAEQFLPGRRTIWRFEGGLCRPGRWWTDGAAVCFAYDSDPEPICWDFRNEGGGPVAELLEDGAPSGFALRLERIETASLPCLGPEVGS